MILTGLIVSSFNGKITTLSDTILSSSKEAVELCILMFGIVGLWSGLMNIALSLGITTQLQKLLTPFLTFLFPNLKNQKAKEYQYKYCRKYIRSWLGCNSFRIKSYGRITKR